MNISLLGIFQASNGIIQNNKTVSSPVFKGKMTFRLGLGTVCGKDYVPEERLELSRLAVPAPKAGASTNFATPARFIIRT